MKMASCCVLFWLLLLLWLALCLWTSVLWFLFFLCVLLVLVVAFVFAVLFFSILLFLIIIIVFVFKMFLLLLLLLPSLLCFFRCSCGSCSFYSFCSSLYGVSSFLIVVRRRAMRLSTASYRYSFGLPSHCQRCMTWNPECNPNARNAISLTPIFNNAFPQNALHNALAQP
jgi:hypothetical protein